MVDAIKTIYLEGQKRGEVKKADIDDVAIFALSLLDSCLHIDFTRTCSKDPERPVRLLRLKLTLKRMMIRKKILTKKRVSTD